MKHQVHIIGGGLAGSEAAWQLARRGIRVRLSEMRGTGERSPVPRISLNRTRTPRRASCHAASLPASPPPMMWTWCFIRPHYPLVLSLSKHRSFS